MKKNNDTGPTILGAIESDPTVESFQGGVSIWFCDPSVQSRVVLSEREAFVLIQRLKDALSGKKESW